MRRSCISLETNETIPKAVDSMSAAGAPDRTKRPKAGDEGLLGPSNVAYGHNHGGHNHGLPPAYSQQQQQQQLPHFHQQQQQQQQPQQQPYPPLQYTHGHGGQPYHNGQYGQQQQQQPPVVGPPPGYGTHMWGGQPPPTGPPNMAMPPMYRQQGGGPPNGVPPDRAAYPYHSRQPPPPPPNRGRPLPNTNGSAISPPRGKIAGPPQGKNPQGSYWPGQQWPQHQWRGPPPPHGWQGGPPMIQPGSSPSPNMPQHMQPMNTQKIWNTRQGQGNDLTSPPRQSRGSPESMRNGYPPMNMNMNMNVNMNMNINDPLCKSVGMDGAGDMDMYMSRGPDDGSSKSKMSQADKDKGRGSYRCGRVSFGGYCSFDDHVAIIVTLTLISILFIFQCGAPKKGHVCPYQPKLKRRPDEPPPVMRNAALQVEMDEFMTLRRLNIEIQGFPESYATAPLMSDNLVVGEPHPLALAPMSQPERMDTGVGPDQTHEDEDQDEDQDEELEPQPEELKSSPQASPRGSPPVTDASL